MGEAVHMDPWTDEVCQDWLDTTQKKARRLQLSGSETDMYFGPRIPKPVRDYRFRQVAERLAAAFNADPVKAISELAAAGAMEVVSVEIGPAD